jgi:hypothetical protein
MDTRNNRNDKSPDNEISRRGFLEIGSAAAVTTAGVLLAGVASGQSWSHR